MTIYLAHNFKAREILLPVIRGLESQGHEVTSTWITDDSHITEKNAQQSAMIDLQDIDRAVAFLLFTEQYGPSPGKGKFLVLGYAYARNKLCFIMGTDESCVFYALPKIFRVLNYTELYKQLSLIEGSME